MTSCPPTERLEAFLEENLSAAERDALGPHVAACRSCQATLERLTEAPAALRQSLSSVRRRPPGGGAVAAPLSFFGRLKQAAAAPRAPRPGPPELPAVAGYEVL
jgi:hypothetical protein